MTAWPDYWLITRCCLRTGTVTITAQCPGASASCTVIVIPLADGVYRIQNLDNYKYLTDGGGGDTALSYLSGNSRSQMWLIKNVSGTIRYTLNPLSCTTIEYSGTDYGLLGGYDVYDTGVCIDSISNGITSFSYGEWFISGNALSGFRIVSYAADDYDIMVRNSSGTGVELEYEENLNDEEDPIDQWMFTEEIGLPSVTEISFNNSTISIRIDTVIVTYDLIDSIILDTYDAPDCRSGFTKTGSSVGISKKGIVTVLAVGQSTVCVKVGTVEENLTVNVQNPPSISLTASIYYLWSFYDNTPKHNYTKNNYHFVFSAVQQNNIYIPSFETKLYNTRTQYVVFEKNTNNRYKIYLDPSGNSSDRIYINCNPQNHTVCYSNSSDSATVWFVESYGGQSANSSNCEIVISTVANNLKYYLHFNPDAPCSFGLSSEPYGNFNGEAKLYATPASNTNANITLLSVQRPGISGVDWNERSYGWLDLITGAESLPDASNGSPFKRTLRAYCGSLDDSMVQAALQNSKTIIFRGHGAAGKLYYDEACYESNTLTSGEIASPNFSIPYAEIIIFGSCNSGSGGSMSLVSRASAKGVPIVIGFTDVLNRQVFAVFQYLFFENYNCFLDGNTSYDSIEDVVSQSYASACALVNGQGCLVGDDNTVFSSIVIVETN